MQGEAWFDDAATVQRYRQYTLDYIQAHGLQHEHAQLQATTMRLRLDDSAVANRIRQTAGQDRAVIFAGSGHDDMVRRLGEHTFNIDIHASETTAARPRAATDQPADVQYTIQEDRLTLSPMASSMERVRFLEEASLRGTLDLGTLPLQRTPSTDPGRMGPARR